ncbi:ABC transporter permease [uncultured Draconibacterium sp.]|uniref:ABC transporter permease n=1 Tax=uncultured Draconibacterium sp. TaxID=1573823 RepID=UPI0025CE4546|nr:ABC transporter permease [uncultured Draconibacterium sp.]
MIKHFLIIAWRNIFRRKTLSAIQILCLSVGLAAFTLVARYIQYEKDYDKFNQNFERIYRLHTYKIKDRTDDSNQTVVPMAKYLRNNIAEVEDAIIISEVWGEYLSADAENVFNEELGFVAPSGVFEMFSFELIRGDKNTLLDDPNAIVLSETLAAKYFPGQDPMGKIIFDEKKRELRVTGVMKDIPEQSTIQASYFKSNTELLKSREHNWDNSSYRCMVLLKPNVNPETINSKIVNVINKFDEDAKNVAYLRPLALLHLNEGPRDDRGSVIFFFSFIGILTLLLACVSFMNLTTSFSTLRSVEIGVRKVSGSSSNYIRLQFLTEAIVLAFVSLVGAIALAYLLLPLFNAVVNRNIEINLIQNPQFILFLLISVLVTGFVGGSYPALVTSSYKPVAVLKSKLPLKKGRITGLQAMVYVQFILSVVLITSSIWMYRQVNYMKNKDLGFNKENLLYCKLPSMDADITYQQFRQRILEYPGIEDLSFSINSPLHDNWGTRVRFEDGSVEDHTFVRWNQACENYLPTMNMTLIEGRNFSSEFSAEAKSCLINQTAVKTFGWTNPIGKWIDIKGDRKLVVGVIKDFNIEDVHNPILPYVLLYRDFAFGYSNDITFKVNPETTQASLAHINKVLQDILPNILFEVNGYDFGSYRMALKIWTNVKDTFAFFTVMAVVIAAMGLFGLVVFSSQRRVKEIGIRKVQGAKTEQIMPLITKQFVIFVIAANVVSYPLAIGLENVTPGHFKYSFTVIDVVIVLAISLVVTLIASGFQAFKAARLNPVEALRYE